VSGVGGEAKYVYNTLGDLEFMIEGEGGGETKATTMTTASQKSPTEPGRFWRGLWIYQG